MKNYMEPDADTSVEQPSPTPTNLLILKYVLRQNPKPNCNDDFRYWTFILSNYGLTNAYVHFPEILGTCYGMDMCNEHVVQAPSSPSQTMAKY